MQKPVILFFARGYQADFFPVLQSDRYRAVFVTLSLEERRRVEAQQSPVAACFEESFDDLPEAPIDDGYLVSSFAADRFLGRFSYRMRRKILGKEIAFWRQLFDEHHPVAVVNELVAIEISEILLAECRRRNIRYLAGMNCVVDDLFYWLPDPLSLSGENLEERVPDARARELAALYLAEVQVTDYKPFYVRNLAARRDLKPLAVSFARLGLWLWRRFTDVLWQRFRYEAYVDEYSKKIAVYFKSLIIRYDTLDALPARAEVIFYPLHQEPEATLNYMSEFCANQVATIENILKCMTPDQILVVKEHPVDKGALLRRKFQQLKSEQSALYYLPAELHGREVLRFASRVVTLTSTVGWEAAIAGKAVYVMGKIFYDNAKGVRRVDSFPELRTLLHSPPQTSGGGVDQFTGLVANMVAASKPGNPFPHPGLYGAENKARIVAAICDAAGI